MITDDMSENVVRMASHLKQLEKKRDELQRQCTAIESMNRQSEVNRLIDKNKELKQDVFVLKNLTYRYNLKLVFSFLIHCLPRWILYFTLFSIV